jgi:hypothetical protein
MLVTPTAIHQFYLLLVLTLRAMVQSRTLALWAFPVHTHAMDFFRTRAKALSIMAASLDSKLISGYRWALVRGAAYMLLCASGTSRSLWSVRSVSHFIINDGWSSTGG